MVCSFFPYSLQFLFHCVSKLLKGQDIVNSFPQFLVNEEVECIPPMLSSLFLHLLHVSSDNSIQIHVVVNIKCMETLKRMSQKQLKTMKKN